ncbi:hypothetical protein BsWGS_11398 [Bradybaena similaris]
MTQRSTAIRRQWRPGGGSLAGRTSSGQLRADPSFSSAGFRLLFVEYCWRKACCYSDSLTQLKELNIIRFYVDNRL